jgi:hypothetical protein
MAGHRLGLLERRVLAGVVAVHLLFAVAASSTHGQSWDDPQDALYGRVALRAYAGSVGYLDAADERYYGPEYLMASGVVIQGVGYLAPAVQAADVQHVLNFIMLLVAAAALYGLERRVTGPAASGLTAFLFLYQPVLFGHGFVNQKDVPFMAAFAVTILLGLRLGDPPPQGPDLEGWNRPGHEELSFLRGLARGWAETSVLGRSLLVVLIAGALALCAELVGGRGLLSAGEAILASAYRGEAWTPIRELFQSIATDAYKTPLESYLAKLDNVFAWVRVVVCYAAAAVVVGAAASLARRGGYRGRPWRQTAPWLLAALALGLATSIRVAGVLAGALVSLALVVTQRRKVLLPLFGYWVVAGSVTYLTWPYLWGQAAARFIESTRFMANFPAHEVLFRGLTMASTRLPWDYLPTLLAIQLTEPALLLAGIGLAGIWTLWRRGRGERLWLAVVAVWFLVPVLASVFLRIPLYSNFRQVLFGVPPLFLVAGLGIERVWGWARGGLARLVLVAAVLLPGPVAIIRLFPYEYIYYNAFVGGTRGAEGLFPHDYWCTSYREAMAFVNEHAGYGAHITVLQPFAAAATFARPDLVLADSRQAPNPDLVLRCNNRGDLTLENLRDFPVAFVVTREGVVLSAVFDPGSDRAVAPSRSGDRTSPLGAVPGGEGGS